MFFQSSICYQCLHIGLFNLFHYLNPLSIGMVCSSKGTDRDWPDPDAAIWLAPAAGCAAPAGSPSWCCTPPAAAAPAPAAPLAAAFEAASPPPRSASPAPPSHSVVSSVSLCWGLWRQDHTVRLRTPREQTVALDLSVRCWAQWFSPTLGVPWTSAINQLSLPLLSLSRSLTHTYTHTFV